jgi:hypothetical protein
MLALFAYVGSLLAAAAGLAMLLQVASGPGKDAPSAQVRKAAPIAKPAVSSAGKAVERRADAPRRAAKRKKVVQEKPRRRVAERYQGHWGNNYRYYNRW